MAAESVNPDDSATRRKRLGQYFTGAALAEVLARLAGGDTATSAIDPMAGSGDMLMAVDGIGGGISRLQAVEIDPTAADTCRSRLSSVGSFSQTLASAFSPAVWQELATEWDLVITNPPYIRYQLTSLDSFHGVSIPSASQVRRDLLQSLDLIKHLSASEKEAFKTLARGYSGLADMAVPSWILCAALVKPGGRLAMVVPDTWLTREYASPVLYLLGRYFSLEFVVRDADAAWFDDALVRTTLVVAQRVPDRGTAFVAQEHLDVSLTKAASEGDSLLAGAFPGTHPTGEFVKWAKGLRQRMTGGAKDGVMAVWNDGTDLLSALTSGAARLKDIEVAPDFKPQVPRILRPFVADSFDQFTTLSELGWRVGQGLRSGANDFFYVEEAPDGGFRSPLLPTRLLDLPSEVLRSAVRSQSDLPDGQSVVRRTAQRLLVLNGWIHPADLSDATESVEWRIMEGHLVDLVSQARRTTYQRRGREVAIPSLSAVRTNVTRGDDGRVNRHWYHLPTLQPRHTPALFIPRVNHGTPRPYMPGAAGWVVDANFSTLWAEKEVVSPEALIAVLSSAWAGAYMESLGTVLGGGALKLEAAQIRRLLLPRLSDSAIQDLHQLGEALIAPKPSSDIINHVNDVVLKALGHRKVPARAADELLKLARARQLQQSDEPACPPTTQPAIRSARRNSSDSSLKLSRAGDSATRPRSATPS